MDLLKGLIDDVVRLRCEISDVKRDRDEIHRKYTELLTDHERVSNLLEMYCAEARREIEKKEFNIVEAVAAGSAAVASTASVETDDANSDVTEEKNVIIDPLEAKKAARKEYMRSYMKLKRALKEAE